jgi:ribonuclease BN (tRNA processing enzyme)
MASDVANKINAKCLILNHFSQRYKPVNYIKEEKSETSRDGGADDEEQEDNVAKLVEEAKLDFKENVLASFDLFTYKV